MGIDVNRAREWVNQNSAAVTIGAVVVLIFSLAYLWFSGSSGGGTGSREPVAQWFYDVNAKKYFEVKDGSKPPIPAPSGTGNAYAAYMFSCGECTESERFVGYYEGFTPEYKAAWERATEASKNGTGATSDDMMYLMEEGDGKGRLISADAVTWVEQNSPEGLAITSELSKKCEGKGRLRPCYPGM